MTGVETLDILAVAAPTDVVRVGPDEAAADVSPDPVGVVVLERGPRPGLRHRRQGVPHQVPQWSAHVAVELGPRRLDEALVAVVHRDAAVVQAVELAVLFVIAEAGSRRQFKGIKTVVQRD